MRCLVRNGKLYKRYNAKHGRAPTPGFISQYRQPHAFTRDWFGWVPVGDGPADKRYKEAWVEGTEDGFYMLAGPKINGNPLGLEAHTLVKLHVDQKL